MVFDNMLRPRMNLRWKRIEYDYVSFFGVILIIAYTMITIPTWIS